MRAGTAGAAGGRGGGLSSREEPGPARGVAGWARPLPPAGAGFRSAAAEAESSG